MKELKEKYINNLNNGCNRLEAIQEALNTLYVGQYKYIHLDSYEDFSHIFIGNEVLFYDGCIYTKIGG